MKTTIPRKTEIRRDWIEIDASGKTLGRVAVLAASRLRGKHKATFTPHLDTGDFVIVMNASDLRLTGNKLRDKAWTRYSGYPGGMKTTPYGTLLEKNPRRLIELAVRRMLPKNRLGRRLFTKLKVYAGGEHPHAAQNPVRIEVK